jgi:uncharacterized protein with HEPN domain
MRNVIVHEYFGIDAPIIWEAATQEVPTLRSACLRMLARMNE